MVRLTARIGFAGLLYVSALAPAAAQDALPEPTAFTIQDHKALDANGDGALRDKQSDEGVSEQDAIAAARREGLERVAAIRSSGGSFRIEGSDVAGHDLSILVDRRSGNVLSVDRGRP